MLLAFHTTPRETNINLYTHHSTPPCRYSVSPARALRRTSSRNRSWNVGVSPILESLSKGMSSIRRSTRRLAGLRHTNERQSRCRLRLSQVDDGLIHRLPLALVHCYQPAQGQGYLVTCLVASVVTRGTLRRLKGRDGYAPFIARVSGPNRPCIPFQTQDYEIRKSRSSHLRRNNAVDA